MKQKLVVSVSSFVLMSCWAGSVAASGVNSDLALIDAVENNDMASVKQLIDYDRNVNVRGKFQGTALHRAAHHGYTNIGELLVENGARVDVQNVGGTSPLHKAATSGHSEFVELLVKEGADVNMRDGEGRTPLLRAVQKKRLEVVKLLLSLGADAEIESFVGETPATVAVRLHDASVVRVLLENGVDFMRLLDGGRTLQDVALQSGGVVAEAVSAFLQEKETELQAAILKENQENIAEEKNVAVDPFVENKVAEIQIEQQLKIAQAEAELARKRIEAAKVEAEASAQEAKLRVESIKAELEKARVRREIVENARKKRLEAEEAKRVAEEKARQEAEAMRKQAEYENKLQKARELLESEQQRRQKEIDEAKRMVPDYEAPVLDTQVDDVTEVSESDAELPADNSAVIALEKKLAEVQAQLELENAKRAKSEKRVLDMSRIAAAEILNLKKAWKKEVSSIKENEKAAGLSLQAAKAEAEEAKKQLEVALKSHQSMKKDSDIVTASIDELKRKLQFSEIQNLEMKKELDIAKTEADKMHEEMTLMSSKLEAVKQELNVVDEERQHALVALKELQEGKLVQEVSDESLVVTDENVMDEESSDVEMANDVEMAKDESHAVNFEPEKVGDSVPVNDDDIVENVENVKNVPSSSDSTIEHEAKEETIIEDVASVEEFNSEEVLLDDDVVEDEAISSEEGASLGTSLSTERMTRIERQIRALEEKKWQQDQLERAEAIMGIDSAEQEADSDNVSADISEIEKANKIVTDHQVNIVEDEAVQEEKEVLEIEFNEADPEIESNEVIGSAQEIKDNIAPEVQGESVDEVISHFFEQQDSHQEGIKAKDVLSQQDLQRHKETVSISQSARSIIREIKQKQFINEDLEKLKKHRIALEKRIAEREKNSSVAQKTVDTKQSNARVRFKSVQEKMQAIASRMKPSSSDEEVMGNKRTIDMLNDEFVDVARSSTFKPVSGEQLLVENDALSVQPAVPQGEEEGRRDFLANLEKKLSSFESEGALPHKAGKGGDKIAKLPWIESDNSPTDSNGMHDGLRITRVLPVDHDIEIKTQADANRKNVEKIARIIASIQKAKSINEGKVPQVSATLQEVKKPDNTAVSMVTESENMGMPASMADKKVKEIAALAPAASNANVDAKEFELRMPGDMGQNIISKQQGYWLKVGDFVDGRTAYQHYKNVRDSHLLRGLKYRPVYSAQAGYKSVAFKVGPVKTMQEATSLCMKFRGNELGCATTLAN